MTLTARWRARRMYQRADKLAGQCSRDLYTTRDPLSRAQLLEQFADATQAMARVHTGAFGPAPNPDEDGRDHVESLSKSATLLRMLAASERAAVAPDEGSRYVFWCIADYAKSAELDLWAELAATRDRHDRAALMEDIYPYARERIGGQAAEALACHVHTELELADADTAGRSPRAPKTMAPWRAVAMVAVIVGVLFIARDLFPHWGLR